MLKSQPQLRKVKKTVVKKKNDKSIASSIEKKPKALKKKKLKKKVVAEKKVVGEIGSKNGEKLKKRKIAKKNIEKRAELLPTRDVKEDNPEIEKSEIQSTLGTESESAHATSELEKREIVQLASEAKTNAECIGNTTEKKSKVIKNKKLKGLKKKGVAGNKLVKKTKFKKDGEKLKKLKTAKKVIVRKKDELTSPCGSREDVVSQEEGNEPEWDITASDIEQNDRMEITSDAECSLPVQEISTQKER